MINIETLALISLSVINIVLLFLLIIYIYRYKSLLRTTVQVALDKIVLQDHIAKISSDGNEPDGFIKFLSDSRQWAFDYIENVQSAVKNLKDAMDSDDEEKISLAYNELIKFLPEVKND